MTHFRWQLIRSKKIVPVSASGQLMVHEAGSLLAACLAGQGGARLLELYARAALAVGRLMQALPEC